MEAFAAALQIAADESGAADAAPVARNVTAAVAKNNVVSLPMCFPQFASAGSKSEYIDTLHVNAGNTRPMAYESTLVRTHQSLCACASICAAAAAASSFA